MKHMPIIILVSNGYVIKSNPQQVLIDKKYEIIWIQFITIMEVVLLEK